MIQNKRHNRAKKRKGPAKTPKGVITKRRCVIDKAIGETRAAVYEGCLLYTSPSPRDQRGSRMPSSA